MMKKLISAIRINFEKKSTLLKKNKILCTYSGGQDSTLTFFILLHFQKELQYCLESVYCHHFLQEKNFTSFWQLIRINYFFSNPISIVLSVDNLKTENEARRWRKKSFERIFLLQKSSTLFLGHTASDKLETIISNIKRGTSSQGLINFDFHSIYKNQSIFLFFPLTFLFEAKKSTLSPFIWKKKKLFQDSSILWPFKLKKVKTNFVPNFQFGKRTFRSKRKISQLTTYRRTTSNQIEVKNSLILKSSNGINQTQISHNKYLLYSLYSSPLNFSLVSLRPLVFFHRNDVRMNCQIFQLPVISDPTNDFSELSRNQIRHQINPLIRYFFSTKIEFFSFRCLDILMLEHQYHLVLSESLLLKFLKINYKKCLLSFKVNIHYAESQTIKKSRKCFQNLKIPLQRICLQKLFFYYTNIQLNYSQIEFLKLTITKK